jgi:hypothetical protein
MNDGWISVRNWSRFQHYDPAKRGQPWIKDYVGQLDEDEYRDLTFAQRGLLQDIRRSYARARCELSADPVRLSRRFGSQVRRNLLDSLVHAGYIEIVASRLLADGYHAASTEVEREVERETPLPPLDIPVEDLPPFSSRADELRAAVALSPRKP